MAGEDVFLTPLLSQMAALQDALASVQSDQARMDETLRKMSPMVGEVYVLAKSLYELEKETLDNDFPPLWKRATERAFPPAAQTDTTALEQEVKELRDMIWAMQREMACHLSMKQPGDAKLSPAEKEKEEDPQPSPTRGRTVVSHAPSKGFITNTRKKPAKTQDDESTDNRDSRIPPGVGIDRDDPV